MKKTKQNTIIIRQGVEDIRHIPCKIVIVKPAAIRYNKCRAVPGALSALRC